MEIEMNSRELNEPGAWREAMRRARRKEKLSLIFCLLWIIVTLLACIYGMYHHDDDDPSHDSPYADYLGG